MSGKWLPFFAYLWCIVCTEVSGMPFESARDSCNAPAQGGGRVKRMPSADLWEQGTQKEWNLEGAKNDSMLFCCHVVHVAAVVSLK